MRSPFSNLRLPFLQDLIHRFEEGGGVRYLRWVIGLLLLLILVATYNLRAFRNFGTIEAMDTAQLARNLSKGKGYSTSFIRPFSVYLVKEWNTEHKRHPSDQAQLNGNHPDLANPPAYPVLLAGLMKVLPFDYEAHTTERFWSKNGLFHRFQPDFLISIFNQLLFFVVIFLTFKLARRLFDAEVAWVSALVLLGTELLWRFSASGLSTMLLMLILVALAWALVLREEWGRDESCGRGRLIGVGAAIGALVGLGALTRYSFSFVILPVLLFLVLFAGRWRIQTVLVAVLAFILVLAPWIARNYYVSGHAFGIASYALVSDTTVAFSGNHLERSLQPQLLVTALMKRLLWKLSSNLPPIFQGDLPKLGGSWVSAFFLVGLMIGYKREGPRRLRHFLVACVALFILVQALGRTYLSEESPELNSENLLVLLAPLIVVFGVSLFFLLLEQVQLPVVELRRLIVGLFLLVATLPLILFLVSPKPGPVTPPYFPAYIQVAAGEVKKTELTMSDMPWAMAWYGGRDCIWLTLKPFPAGDEPSGEDLVTVSYNFKRIAQLYLSPITFNRKPLNPEKGWTDFVLKILVNRQLPPPEKAFPLTVSLHQMEKIQQGHLILMPWDANLLKTSK